MPRKASRRRNSAPLRAALSLLLLGAAVPAFAGDPPAAKPAAAAPAKVEKSTVSATGTTPALLEPQTIAEVYNATGVRDPFISVLGSGAAVPVSDSGETPRPNIHNLALRGILSGAKSKFAMIEDPSSGLHYVLKEDGKLYDSRGKAVAGIVGAIKSASTAMLTTSADGDVQALKLGEQKQ